MHRQQNRKNTPISTILTANGRTDIGISVLLKKRLMSDKQMQEIANVFDAVGISYYEKAEKYNGDISLTVYDQESVNKSL